MLRYHSAFGEVWKGVVHGTEVAVKKLLIKDIKNERGIIQDFLREVQMMTYVHPHPAPSSPCPELFTSATHARHLPGHTRAQEAAAR